MSAGAWGAIAGIVIGHVLAIAVIQIRHVLWMRKFDREHGQN